MYEHSDGFPYLLREGMYRVVYRLSTGSEDRTREVTASSVAMATRAFVSIAYAEGMDVEILSVHRC